MNISNILSIIKLLIIVSIISFLVDKIIYYSLKDISSKIYTGQTVGKLNQYLSTKDTLDLIVYGSSRANHHIDPRQISNKSFNMGMDGQFIGYFTTLIKLLPKHSEQKVILHLDPFKLFDADYNGDDVRSLIIKYHENDVIRDEINKTGNISFLNYFFWTLDYNRRVLGIVKNYFKPKYNYKNYSGYDPLILSKTQEEIRNKTLKKTSENNCEENGEKNSLFINYLKEIRNFCNENDKELIVISSPVYHDPCLHDNRKLVKVMDSLEIHYVDYTYFFKNNGSLSLWKDNIHLSDKGAKIFTAKLSKDLLRLEEKRNN